VTGNIPRRYTCPQTVTHLCINLASHGQELNTRTVHYCKVRRINHCTGEYII